MNNHSSTIEIGHTSNSTLLPHLSPDSNNPISYIPKGCPQLLHRHSLIFGKTIVMLLVGIVGLFLGLFSTATPLQAAEITISDSVPLTRTPWVRILSVPQFDPSIGALQRVRLSFSTQLRGDGYYENRSEVTSTLSFEHRGEIVLNFDNGDELGTITATAQSTLEVPPYDGQGGFNSGPLPQDDAERLKALFNGTSGGLSEANNTSNHSFVYTDTAELQRFIGTGPLEITFFADAESTASDTTGNVDYELRSSAAAVMSVTYEYIVTNIQLQKTVYLGHNGGASCPGAEKVVDEQGKPNTYCFKVTNTGETYLNSITISDTTLGISEKQMTLISGTLPLAPNASLVFYVEGTLDKQLVNLAIVEGTPVDSGGNRVPGLDNPTDEDTAEVDVTPRADPETDEPLLNKKLFLPLVAN
ncbi:MAG: choice-of-anchor E domain-containing protein [Caldilineaceae bacterium]